MATPKLQDCRFVAYKSVDYDFFYARGWRIRTDAPAPKPGDIVTMIGGPKPGQGGRS
jgi:hypothetical protein